MFWLIAFRSVALGGESAWGRAHSARLRVSFEVFVNFVVSRRQPGFPSPVQSQREQLSGMTILRGNDRWCARHTLPGGENPKFEARNSKQIPMTKMQRFKRAGPVCVFRRWENLGFELVSNFEIRASNLPFVRLVRRRFRVRPGRGRSGRRCA
jgi:hypothetical protein